MTSQLPKSSLEQDVLPDTSRCSHCGLEIVGGQAVRGSDPDTVFCCKGCRLVYRTLHEFGLGKFYELRDDSELRTADPRGNRFGYFDHDDFIHRHVHSLSRDLSEVRLAIPGIHCAACVWVLEKLPQVLAGVTHTRVNLSDGTIVLTYIPSEVKLSEIAQTLDSLGYTPAPLSLDERLKQRRKLKRALLLRLGVAAATAGNTMIISVSLYQGYFSGMELKYRDFFHWISLIIALPCVFYAAIPFYRGALAGLLAKRPHVDMPISLGILFSFFLSVHATVSGLEYVYFESVCALVFLLLIGRYVQQEVLAGVQSKLSQAATFFPLSVLRKSGGEFEEIPLEALRVGDEIKVLPGERAPADGIVVEGSTHLDLSVLSGESAPVSIAQEQEVPAGALNLESAFLLEARSIGRDSRVGKLLEQLQEAPTESSSSSRLINSLSGYFVITVLVLGFLGFLAWLPTGIPHAFEVMVAVFVVSCPCALALGPPLIFSGATRKALSLGIFLKNMKLFEERKQIRQVFFDKTGTLTTGAFEVVGCNTAAGESVEPEWLSHVLALEEGVASHPLAHTLLSYVRERVCDISAPQLRDLSYISGCGVVGKEDRKGRTYTWKLGSLSWAIDGESTRGFEATNSAHTVVCLSCNGVPKLFFELQDTLHPETTQVVQQLRKEGVAVGILSGDRQEVVSHVAEQLGIAPEFAHGGLLPQQKAECIASTKGRSIFVGDGANDVAALLEADIGIGLRSGVEVCLENADIFISEDGMKRFGLLWSYAKKVSRALQRNVVVSIAYNIGGVSLALAGYITPLFAALLMSISSLSVLFSSLWIAYASTDKSS